MRAKERLLPFLKLLTLSLIFLLIGAFSILFFLFFTPPRGKLIKVPNVVGKDFVTGFDILSKHGLQIKKVLKADSEVPKDHIISQTPPPGKEVREGREVIIKVSKGPGVIKVPDIRGKTVLEAKNILNQTGFGIIETLRIGRLVYVHSSEIEKGCIIAHTPPPECAVPRRTEVNLLVSKGPPKKAIYIPNFIGKDFDTVTERMKELGLTLGKILTEVHDELEEGTIVSQTPPFGYRVDEGDSIDLVVSIKSPEAKRKIPRFTMIRYSTPEGFYPKRVRIVVIDDRGTHEVYNQVVKPGEEIEVTTKVVGEATAKIYVSGELMEERILR